MSVVPYNDQLLFANNAQTTLAGSITNTATTMAVASGGGALFPNPSPGQAVPLTITDAATGLLREIVLMTARVGDTMTIIRAQEGTTGLPWSANDIVAQLVTAGGLTTFLQVAAAQAQSYNYGDDVGSANAYQVLLDPAITANVAGMPIRIKIAHDNTGPSTLDAGAGPSAIKRRDGSDLIGNELTAGNIVEFYWDGIEYILSNAAPTTDAAATAGTDDQSSITPAQLAAALASLQPPTGQINAFGGSSAPSGYLLCFGQAVSRTTYASLFAVIGTAFGSGNGTTTFNLPDLRGRTLVGKDDMGGSAANRVTSATMTPDGVTLGATGGTQQVTLTSNEQASMSVTGACTATGTTDQTATVNTSGQGIAFGNISSGAGQTAYAASPTVAVNGSISGTATGSGGAHLNMQPSQVVNYIIKT